MTRAGIYTRLSSDPDGTSTACDRQEADARAFAGQRGWEVAATYRDNDASAYKRRRRPEFERLLAEVSGLDVVIVWKSDRLARQPRDLERFLDACEERGVRLVSCTEPDFDGAAGRLMLRMFIAFASHESAVKAERVARAKRATAEAGLPTGSPRPFGYETELEVNEAEARHIREGVESILEGASLRSVARAWNRAGVTTTRGNQWNAGLVRRIVTNPRYAGRRLRHGVDIGRAAWPAIITGDDQAAVLATLAGRRRADAVNTKGTALLSGLARCGRCGKTLGSKKAPRGTGRTYACRSDGASGCGRLSVSMPQADERVETMFLATLVDPAGLAELAKLRAPTGDAREAAAGLRAAEGRLELLAAAYGRGELGHAEWMAARQAATEAAQTAREELARSAPAAPAGVDPEVIVSNWFGAAVEQRRAWLTALVDHVVVHPGRPGRFDWSRVEVVWKTGGRSRVI